MMTSIVASVDLFDSQSPNRFNISDVFRCIPMYSDVHFHRHLHPKFLQFLIALRQTCQLQLWGHATGQKAWRH